MMYRTISLEEWMSEMCEHHKHHVSHTKAEKQQQRFLFISVPFLKNIFSYRSSLGFGMNNLASLWHNCMLDDYGFNSIMELLEIFSS